MAWQLAVMYLPSVSRAWTEAAGPRSRLGVRLSSGPDRDPVARRGGDDGIRNTPRHVFASFAGFAILAPAS
jgi:hypothetical protein